MNGRLGPLGSRIAANIGWNALSELIGKGSLFLASIYLARTLGPESYGLLTLAQAAAMYVWYLADLGVGVYGIKEVAQNPERAEKAFNNLTTLRLALGAVGLVLLVFIAEFVIRWGDQFKATLIACGFWLLVVPLHAEWVLKGLEKFSLLAKAWAAFSVVYLGGLAFLVHGTNDIATAAILWVAGYAAAAGVMLASLKSLLIRVRPECNVSVCVAHIKKASLFAVSGWLSSTCAMMPFFIIPLIASAQVLGLVAAPLRLVSGVLAFGYYICTGFYPVLADLYERNREAYRKTGRELRVALLAAGIGIAAVGYVFREQICAYVLGPEYLAAKDALGILMWTVPLGYMHYALATSLRCGELQRYQPVPYAIGLVTMGMGFAYVGWIGVESPTLVTVPLIMGDIVMLGVFLLLGRWNDIVSTNEKGALSKTVAGVESA